MNVITISPALLCIDAHFVLRKVLQVKKPSLINEILDTYMCSISLIKVIHLHF